MGAGERTGLVEDLGSAAMTGDDAMVRRLLDADPWLARG
jgi:hypothetical protein